MKTEISKRELGNDLLYDTLSALYKTLSRLHLPLYIVGATARDITMLILGETEAKRKTMDLDVAVAIPDWQKFDEIQESLLGNHFIKLKPKQKFSYLGENGDNDYEVDIVPFGGVSENEEIRWRPDGIPVMSVKCFSDLQKITW